MYNVYEDKWKGYRAYQYTIRTHQRTLGIYKDLRDPWNSCEDWWWDCKSMFKGCADIWETKRTRRRLWGIKYSFVDFLLSSEFFCMPLSPVSVAFRFVCKIFKHTLAVQSTIFTTVLRVSQVLIYPLSPLVRAYSITICPHSIFI